MSGLKDDTTGLEKGSIVDIAGNTVGTVTQSGDVEFSKEEISSFLLSSPNGSQNENSLYFRPTQDFAGEIQITIHATSAEGGSVSEVGSSSTNFEIQDGNVTFEYISFSISDNARNIIFKDEIKLQYEIDTEIQNYGVRRQINF